MRPSHPQADKATNAYAAVLMTFLTSAFFFDATTAQPPQAQAQAETVFTTSAFVDSLLAVLVNAMATTLLLLPFKYIIPYVIRHTHGVSCRDVT